jgi:hypothetical protein
MEDLLESMLISAVNLSKHDLVVVFLLPRPTVYQLMR